MPAAAAALVAAYRSHRSSALDRLRGLAILLMVGDHLAVVLGGFESYRLTLGRVAMPLFFLLAGHLVTRFTYRHAGIAWLGVGLPLVVPWIDNPNVLTWYAVGALLLVLARRFNVPVWLLALPGLAFYANRWEASIGGYDPFALLALMALGALVPRFSLERLGHRLPSSLSVLGQRPLTWYVGHLLVLQACVVVGGVL